jgi:nucleoside-diphosphate-sugar epimerase
MEMRDLFRAAKLGLALLPPRGKVSLVAVDDLARLLLTLATHDLPPALYEVDDGHVLTHDEMAQAIGRAVGRSHVLALHLPKAILHLGAKLDKSVRGSGAKLTADRANYLAHPDWTARPALRPPADLWTPSVAPEAGLAATARWYRANGLL